MSTLTGESQPVFRSAEFADATGLLLEARELPSVGRPASAGRRRRSSSPRACGPSSAGSPLSPSVGRADAEPARAQVRRVAWLIALVAVAAGLAFLPIGWLAAGLPLEDALTFAVGLIVANVPEGLLPTLTLALAVGVAGLARRGALVKRLSAVETLGSTNVICTDKTGTLTENRMRRGAVWTPLGELDLEADGCDAAVGADPVLGFSAALAACSTAELAAERVGLSRGEATEIGLLEAGRERWDRRRRCAARARPPQALPLRPEAPADVDRRSARDGGLTVHAKGAPRRCLAARP